MKYPFESIVSHLTTNGFIYPGSAIYNGLANTWDYGPLGVELKNNIKQYWWKKYIHETPNNVGLDSSIILNPSVWKASGHLATFTDPLIDCKYCHCRYRVDKLIEQQYQTDTSKMKQNDLQEFLNTHEFTCPECGHKEFTPLRNFNLMFKTYLGVVEDAKSEAYLRPETAQGIFINFKNVQRSQRLKLPFGIGQIGKVFRNEITPGNFTFRTREFEQAELEFFCSPGEDETWFKYYINYSLAFYQELGIKAEHLRVRPHEKEELSHYSKGTSDIEYDFSFGWGEICGIANRTDYDLQAHSKNSTEVLDYFDPITNKRYFPYCIEPSVGVDRAILAVVCDAYEEEEINNEKRVVLRFAPKVAPIKIAILPLSKQLEPQANKLFLKLKQDYHCDFDVSQSIGKRYRRQDAVGTPLCLTYDFESDNDKSVTIRFRDDMHQERIKISALKTFFKKYFA